MRLSFIRVDSEAVTHSYFHANCYILYLYCICSHHSEEAYSSGLMFVSLSFVHFLSMVNITSALNRTAIVWQDVFDFHEKVSGHLTALHNSASMVLVLLLLFVLFLSQLSFQKHTHRHGFSLCFCLFH